MLISQRLTKCLEMSIPNLSTDVQIDIENPFPLEFYLGAKSTIYPLLSIACIGCLGSLSV
jgi:hypothetical protein